MSIFTDSYCDENCGCDAWWFNVVSQNAHWLGGFAFTSGVPLLFGKWITWFAAIVYTVYSAVKEYYIDETFENATFRGSNTQDFGFALAGIVLGLIVVYFSQLRGTMMPWPPRCRPCCSLSVDEEDDDVWGWMCAWATPTHEEEHATLANKAIEAAVQRHQNQVLRAKLGLTLGES